MSKQTEAAGKVGEQDGEAGKKTPRREMMLLEGTEAKIIVKLLGK